MLKNFEPSLAHHHSTFLDIDNKVFKPFLEGSFNHIRLFMTMRTVAKQMGLNVKTKTNGQAVVCHFYNGSIWSFDLHAEVNTIPEWDIDEPLVVTRILSTQNIYNIAAQNPITTESGKSEEIFSG